MAPGTYIASAAPDSANCVDCSRRGISEEHMVMTGTSQAAPLVAGILALYMNVIGNKPEDALNAMLNNAEHIDTGAGDKCSSNELLAKTPGTKSKSDLNCARGKEHPCKVSGEDNHKPPKSEGGNGCGEPDEPK